jgi:hypothetical protein
VGVVEVLEVVEVDDEQRQLLPVAGHERVQALEQQPPVRQAGEGVGQGGAVRSQVGAVLLGQRGAGLTQEAVVVERDGDDGADLADEALVVVVELGRLVARDAQDGDDAARTRSGTSSRLTMPKRAAYCW